MSGKTIKTAGRELKMGSWLRIMIAGRKTIPITTALKNEVAWIEEAVWIEDNMFAEMS